MSDRFATTEKEKLAQAAFGLDGTMIAMNENTIDNMVRQEKVRKFNNEYEAMKEELEHNNKQFTEAQESLEYDANTAEIKPMFSRVLVKPFKVNPFQRFVQDDKSGLILDAGGYTPHTEFNPITGKEEEQEQFIITGAVVEVGPEVRYLKPGDAIFYRRDTAMPVPFLKSGVYCIGETQVLAVVNENLTKRFENGK